MIIYALGRADLYLGRAEEMTFVNISSQMNARSRVPKKEQ